MITLLLIVGLTVSGVAPIGMAAADDRSSSDAGSVSAEVDSVSADADSVSGDVHRALADVDGEVEVVVRLEPVERLPPQASDRAVQALRTHAKASQGPLRRYAARTDGVAFERGFWVANGALVTVDTDRVALADVAAVDGVTEVHPNFEVEGLESAVAPSPGYASPLAVTPSQYETTYGLEQINASAVWSDFDTRGEGAKVAVLDTGVDVGHPDLDLHTTDPTDPTYPGGWAEFDADANMVAGSEPHDTGYHGTHVSGTVAGGNASGTHIGVAPGVELMHGLVLPDGSGYWTQVTAGMQWAVEEDADVISMSLGSQSYNHNYIEHVRNARDAGVAVVAASGNDGAETSNSPGNVYDALSVGASNASAGIAGFSSGEVVHRDDWYDPPADWPETYVVPSVSAPGKDVYSAYTGSGTDAEYAHLSGTSMATPHVAGVIALMQSASAAHLTPAEIDEVLHETAWKPEDWSQPDDEPDTRYGYGIVDALAAVEAVTPGTVTGNVTDAATDEPIANATVTLVADDGDLQYANETTADGRYEIDDVASNRNYTVTAAADGYDASSATVAVEADGVHELNRSLVGNATIEGVVTDGASGGAIEAATVTADLDGGGTYDAATDANGSYALAVPGNGSYDVTVEATYYRSETLALGHLSSPETRTVDVTLAGNATISGTVTESASGASETGGAEGETGVESTTTEGDPIANASVRASVDGVSWEATTGEDGTYSLPVPDTGETYDLDVSARAFGTNETAATVADDVTVNATLERKSYYLGIDGLEAPAGVEPGESFRVNATVANLGLEDWNDSVAYVFDGGTVATATVSLNASETTTLAFDHDVGEEGSFEHAIATSNETETRSIEVASESDGGGGSGGGGGGGGGGGALPLPDEPVAEEPVGPELSVTDLALSATVVEVNETVVVEAVVENAGDEAGETTLELTVDDADVDGDSTRDTVSVDVPANATRTATLETSFERPGEYELAVSGTAAGSVAVVEGSDAQEAMAAAGDEPTANSTAEPDEDAGSTDAVDRPGDPSDSLPGFGVVAALLALTGVAAARRRS